ncbi:uncharacterized protein LOC132558563 [Ylistrum balloti]|uniref:uncharacterized protein LOC132558563 n=1 Tax=Ylistrum balloti TaxID=509963 RepID=UPI0029059BE0|nr:uncharacterized protein LOC132558563 [Ylistrum balloti]
MDSFCGKLLTSIFILPFTAGHTRRQRNGSWYYDCTITSRVLFLIVLAIVIVFTASKGIHTQAEDRLGIVVILLSLFLVSAMTGIYILGYIVRRNGVESVVNSRRNSASQKLQVIFLWGFGLASGLYCALFVGKQIECFVTSTDGFYWRALFCFNIFLIICLFSEMIFITYFSSFVLKHTLLVNYITFLILTTNTSVIFYIYIMHDTLSYLQEISPEDQFLSCLQNNSTVTVFKVKVKQLLNQTSVEYSLLSITIVLEIWSPTTKNNPESDRSYPRHVESSDTDIVETMPLLDDVTSTSPSKSGNRSKRTVCQMVTLAVSLTTGIGLVVCYIMMATDIGNTETVRLVTEMYSFILKCIMTLALFSGFFCLINYCSPNGSPTGLKLREYVYLLSAFGIFIAHTSKMIAGDLSSDYLAKLVLSESVCGMFQDYLQVVFLLCANRCRKFYPRSNVNLLESVLIFIMVCNFILWVNDSFLLPEFTSTRIMKQGDLPKEISLIEYDLLLPVSVFFRFTSFMEYHATFDKFTM